MERAASRTARERRAPIRDAVFAVVVALMLLGAWKLIAWFGLVVAAP